MTKNHNIWLVKHNKTPKKCFVIFCTHIAPASAPRSHSNILLPCQIPAHFAATSAVSWATTPNTKSHTMSKIDIPVPQGPLLKMEETTAAEWLENCDVLKVSMHWWRVFIFVRTIDPEV
jgi:hypothetical protein